MGLGDWYNLVYSGCEDAKCSLAKTTDVLLLSRVLAKLRTMDNKKTQIRQVESRIRQLVKRGKGGLSRKGAKLAKGEAV